MPGKCWRLHAMPGTVDARKPAMHCVTDVSRHASEVVQLSPETPSTCLSTVSNAQTTGAIAAFLARPPYRSPST